MNAMTESVAPFSELLEQQVAAGPEWLQSLRIQARDRFAAQGMPSRKSEAWRYTSLDPLLAQSFRPALEPPNLDEIRALLPERSDSYRLVLLDGRFSPALSSLPE